MKKIIIISLLLTGIIMSNVDNTTIKEDEEVRAVFISYIEINSKI